MKITKFRIYTLVAVALCLVALVAIVAPSRASDRRRAPQRSTAPPWTQYMGKDFLDIIFTHEQQRYCGLNKLSDKERDMLSKLLTNYFSRLTQDFDLCESAKAYLENEGWEEVKVLGTRRLKLDEYEEAEEYVVEKNPWTYILEPRTYSNLKPGKHLGQMSYTSCEIIDYDGDVERFWTRDTQ